MELLNLIFKSFWHFVGFCIIGSAFIQFFCYLWLVFFTYLENRGNLKDLKRIYESNDE